MSYNLKDDVVKSEKFRREGPRYVCKNCKKKFFAKMEVEQCFDSHQPAKTEGSETPEDQEVKKQPA